MERPIGEVFQNGEFTLKVVAHHSCEGCCFDTASNTVCHPFCAEWARSDKTDVIFVKQENQ